MEFQDLFLRMKHYWHKLVSFWIQPSSSSMDRHAHNLPSHHTRKLRHDAVKRSQNQEDFYIDWIPIPPSTSFVYNYTLFLMIIRYNIDGNLKASVQDLWKSTQELERCTMLGNKLLYLLYPSFALRPVSRLWSWLCPQS